MQGEVQALGGGLHFLNHFRTDWICHGNMCDHAITKECLPPPIGAIDELVDHDEITRLIFFTKRSDGADRQQLLHPQLSHCVEIRKVGNFGRREAVTATMARQKRNTSAFEFSQNEGI